MLGLFDSGNGGLNTVRYIKANFTDVDLVYKIDRANSPYGTKSKKELTEIVQNNISELIERGAEKVLIACCTASTVYNTLEKKYREISIPIIAPIAKRAMIKSNSKSIGVIATQRTVAAHAFKRAMPGCKVTEIPTQELVGLIDNGLNDKTVTEREKSQLERILARLSDKNIDTLILGCTHFPALKSTFLEICTPLGIANIIDSAEVGAEALRHSILQGL